MDQNPNFRALLEGAYAQTPTLAGNFVKFSEFVNRFSELVAERSEKTIDVEEFIKANYPDAKYEPNFKPQDTDDVFLAFRIAPNKLKYVGEVKKKIESIFKTTQTDANGWIPFAIVGQKITRAEYEAMGFLSIRDVVRCLFGKRIELYVMDTAKNIVFDIRVFSFQIFDELLDPLPRGKIHAPFAVFGKPTGASDKVQPVVFFPAQNIFF